MKLLVTLFALVAIVSSAPQGFDPDTQDAEFVPPGIPRRSTGGDSFPGGFGDSFPGGFGDSFPGGFGGPFADGFDVHFINTRPRPNRPSFIDLLFGRLPSDDPKPTTKTTNTSYGFRDIIDGFFGGNIFPSIFHETTGPSFPNLPHFPDIPDLPGLGDLPDGYNNSTYEVKVVNGSRVEVNQTVTKNEGDGVVFTQIFIRVSPNKDEPTEGNAPGSAVAEDDAAPQTPKEEGTEPGNDPSTNQVLTEPIEDFGVSG